MLNKIISLLTIWIICKIEQILCHNKIRIRINNRTHRITEGQDRLLTTWLVETKTRAKEVIFLLRKLGLESMLISNWLLETLGILFQNPLGISWSRLHKKDSNLNSMLKLTRMSNLPSNLENLKELLKKERH